MSKENKVFTPLHICLHGRSMQSFVVLQCVQCSWVLESIPCLLLACMSVFVTTLGRLLSKPPKIIYIVDYLRRFLYLISYSWLFLFIHRTLFIILYDIFHYVQQRLQRQHIQLYIYIGSGRFISLQVNTQVNCGHLQTLWNIETYL